MYNWILDVNIKLTMKVCLSLYHSRLFRLTILLKVQSFLYLTHVLPLPNKKETLRNEQIVSQSLLWNWHSFDSWVLVWQHNLYLRKTYSASKEPTVSFFLLSCSLIHHVHPRLIITKPVFFYWWLHRACIVNASSTHVIFISCLKVYHFYVMRLTET